MADVYDMSDEDYDKLEQNALVSWRFSYPKFAAEADADDASPDHETTNML